MQDRLTHSSLISLTWQANEKCCMHGLKVYTSALENISVVSIATAKPRARIVMYIRLASVAVHNTCTVTITCRSRVPYRNWYVASLYVILVHVVLRLGYYIDLLIVVWESRRREGWCIVFIQLSQYIIKTVSLCAVLVGMHSIAKSFGYCGILFINM